MVAEVTGGGFADLLVILARNERRGVSSTGTVCIGCTRNAGRGMRCRRSGCAGGGGSTDRTEQNRENRLVPTAGDGSMV